MLDNTSLILDRSKSFGHIENIKEKYPISVRLLFSKSDFAIGIDVNQLSIVKFLPVPNTGIIRLFTVSDGELLKFKALFGC